jgi:hypothetical protein
MERDVMSTLPILDERAAAYTDTSERMSATVQAREPHDFDCDDIIRYGAYASSCRSAALDARKAIAAHLDAS